MSQTLLLLSGAPEDRDFAAQVAQTAGLSLVSTADAPEAARIIDRESPAAVFVDASSEALYAAFESAIQSTLGLFSPKLNANVIHFIVSKDVGGFAPLLKSPLFGSLLLRDYGDIAESGRRYGLLVKRSVGDERVFGLERLLSPGVRIQTVRITASSQKQEAVEAVRNFLLAAKFQNRMASVISNAVDEILMNAIFDAPADELGRNTLSSTSRAASFQLEGRSVVEMRVAFDGSCAALSVLDQFGTLDKAKLLAHLSRDYSRSEYKVRAAAAGAGIGLATVFHSGASLIFATESGTKTEVTVFFSRAENFRKFKSQFRFISTHFYF